MQTSKPPGNYRGESARFSRSFDARVHVEDAKKRQRWGRKEFCARLWARREVKILIAGPFPDGLTVNADRAEIARSYSRVIERLRGHNEGFPSWTFSLLRAIEQQVMNHAVPVIGRDNLRCLVALANAPDMTKVPMPARWEKGSIGGVRHIPKIARNAVRDFKICVSSPTRRVKINLHAEQAK